jgi:hypothetical protein
MSEVVGRAGFNVRHLRHGESGTRSDRASLLHESMRELDARAARYYARANPNIVAVDTRLNVAMVNAGDGTFKRATSTAEVLAYGDARIGTRQNAKGEDRVGNNGRVWDARSFETTLIVTALPRSLCQEVPDAYPILDSDGSPVLDQDGAPLMRSRWVARDRDEALRYFAHAAEFLGSQVLTGGQEAIHGYDVNLDEAYPHAQFMADTLAPNPKKPDQLRVEAQQMWGVSKEVLDGDGKVEQPEAKMRRYQSSFRAYMKGHGYDVELEAAERSLASHTREEWAALQEQERIVEALGDKARAKVAVAEKDGANAWADRTAAKAELEAAKQERSAAVTEREEVASIRRRAKEDGLRDAQEDVSEMMRLADLDRAEAARQEEAARAAREAAERSLRTAQEYEEKLAEEVVRLQSEPPDFKQFLDSPVKEGTTFRDIYHRVMAPKRKARASSNAMLAEIRSELRQEGAPMPRSMAQRQREEPA